jgi:hypothetical protein
MCDPPIKACDPIIVAAITSRDEFPFRQIVRKSGPSYSDVQGIKFPCFKSDAGFPDAPFVPRLPVSVSVEIFPCPDRLRSVHPNLRFVYSLCSILYPLLFYVKFSPLTPFLDWIVRYHRGLAAPSIIEFLSFFDVSCDEIINPSDPLIRVWLMKDIVIRFEKETRSVPLTFSIESRAAPRESDLVVQFRENDKMFLVFLPVVYSSSQIIPSLVTPHRQYDFYAGIDDHGELFLSFSQLIDSGEKREIPFAYRAGVKGVKRKTDCDRFKWRLSEAILPMVVYVRREQVLTKIVEGLGLGQFTLDSVGEKPQTVNWNEFPLRSK